MRVGDMGAVRPIPQANFGFQSVFRPLNEKIADTYGIHAFR